MGRAATAPPTVAHACIGCAKHRARAVDVPDADRLPGPSFELNGAVEKAQLVGMAHGSSAERDQAGPTALPSRDLHQLLATPSLAGV